MNEPKVSLFKPVSLFAFLVNVLVLAVSLLLIFIHRDDFPPQVPLWFSQEWGLDRLAEPNFLWLLTILILVCLVCNNIFAKILETNHKNLSLILVWASLFISLVIFFPLYRIILAVT